MAATWRRHVRYEYRKIIKSRESSIKNVNNLWKDNKSKIEEFKIELNECQRRNEWQVGGSKKAKCVDIAKIESVNEDVEAQNCSIVKFYPVEAIPPSYFWTPIRENVRVDDEVVLNHLPHMGDEIFKDDDTFLIDLLKHYRGKVHGKSGVLDDDLFLELVNSLIKYDNSSLDTPKIKCNAIVKVTRMPSPDIFNAISAVFIDKGTPKDFLKKYLHLTKALNPSVALAPPNIDGVDCKSLSRKEALSSYQKYLCRRCFKYNCLLHRTKDSLDRNKLIGPRLEIFKEPCGFESLKCEDSETEIIAEKDVKINKHTKFTLSKIDERREIWTGSEETLFRAVYPAFPGNPCAVAQIILTKTCQDVYEFALQEGHDIPPETTEKLSPPRVVKTNQSVWSIRRRKKQLMKNKDKSYLCGYEPCDHPDKKCDELCSCVSTQNFCEKYCKCSKECQNRYPGCNCKAQCNTKQCSCFIAMRECDPDLCRTCGAHQFDVSKMTCRNVGVQRGLQKHLLLAPSDVAGWGIFLKDSAVKNEFIAEYCGEIISQDEADRRGKIYDKNRSSYLFNLNNDFVVDATRKGNKIRFANHSINPNCCAKVIMVNGDHKIKIFAKRDIQPGEELFLDYRYGKTEQLKFVGIELKD
ncbi:histone-lysine N-methyltransferase E(z) isoform X6 [Cotesia glomerata]|uniref:histone-lysine N-methyltransferase E(z) isoform X6 n=1 Tax=Cotesia glomerata TaxID=32391 RepID=UPI001D00A559|nr:histone-lysine N-methyltransferase E(z) isoform X6 [Cotesia glomerata]